MAVVLEELSPGVFLIHFIETKNCIDKIFITEKGIQIIPLSVNAINWEGEFILETTS